MKTLKFTIRCVKHMGGRTELKYSKRRFPCKFTNATLAIIFCVLNSSSVQGQGYPITDRSPAYATAYVMESGQIMVESGYFAVSDLFDLQSTDINGFASLLRIGLESQTEIRLSTGYLAFHPDPALPFNLPASRGLNSVNVGIKTSIIKEKAISPAVTLLANFELPRPGVEEFTPSHIAPSFRLILEKWLNPTFIVGTNLGFSWRDEPNQSFTYSFSLRTAITEDISLYSEIYGTSAGASPSSSYVDWALEFWLWENIVLDITAGWGISESSDKQFFSLGGGWRIL